MTDQTSPQQPSRMMYRYLALLGVLLVAIVVIIVLMQRGQNEAYSRYTELNDEDTTVRIASITEGDVEQVTAELRFAPGSSEGAIAVDDLPIIEPDQVFGVWAQAADGTQSRAGTIQQKDGNTTYALVQTDAALSEYELLLVTIEPVSGSALDEPNGETIFAFMLSGAQ